MLLEKITVPPELWMAPLLSPVLPLPLLEIDYEETVRDLESVARRLIGACGLLWPQA